MTLSFQSLRVGKLTLQWHHQQLLKTMPSNALLIEGPAVRIIMDILENAFARSNNSAFYRSRGPNDGTVNLNRVNNPDIISPVGQFCCVLPDATMISRKICSSIGE